MILQKFIFVYVVKGCKCMKNCYFNTLGYCDLLNGILRRKFTICENFDVKVRIKKYFLISRHL